MKKMTDDELRVFVIEQIDNALSSFTARWISQDNKDVMLAEKKLFMSDPDVARKLNLALNS